jgi:hypothetical protein
MRCFVGPRSERGYDVTLYAATFATGGPCVDADTPEAFGLVVRLSGLVQLDTIHTTGEDTTLGFTRARLATAIEIVQRVELVASADAAERRIVDASVTVDLLPGTGTVSASDDFFGLWIQAGRMVVPFALSRVWSDANLPFLEHGAPISLMAPAQRQHGASLAAGLHYDIPVAADRSDTTNTLDMHFDVGAFRPTDDGLGGPLDRSYAVVVRGFARRDRDQEYKSVETHLQIGASHAFGRRDGYEEGRHALELDARYYRFRATAEILTANIESASGGFEAAGASFTLSSTIPYDRERYWTEPLPRDTIARWYHVPHVSTDMPNPGFEIDVGLDVMKGDVLGPMERAFSSTAVRFAGHAFLHGFAKLSVAYTFTQARGAFDALPVQAPRHAAIVRLQLAL